MGPVSPGIAKDIMGGNFISVGETSQCFQIQFTEKEKGLLKVVPFSASLLEAYKKTHLLFPGYPLTILDLENKTNNAVYGLTGIEQKNRATVLGLRQEKVLSQSFARKRRVGFRWYLISKNIAPDTDFFSSYPQQMEVLRQKGAEMPMACEVVYMVALYKLAKGQLLDFGGCWVNCQDKKSGIIKSYYLVFQGRRNPRFTGRIHCYASEKGFVFDWFTEEDDSGAVNVGTLASTKPLSLEPWRNFVFFDS